MRQLRSVVWAGAVVLSACGSGTTPGGLSGPGNGSGGSNGSASGGAPGAGGSTSSGGTSTSQSGGTTSNPTGGTTSTPTGGTTSAPTGGTTSTPTGGTTSTGTGGTTALPDGAYYTSGDLHGYVWTAVGANTGSTISPADFASGTQGGPFCASGSVGAMTDYSGVAMVGYNLNQEVGVETFNTWTPTGDGIIVNVNNRGTSPIRIQIQTADGDTNAKHRWCTTLSTFNQDYLVKWSFFNTECWVGGTGTYYDSDGKPPITAVLVLIPGGNTSAVPFDFCLNKVATSGGTSTGTGGTTSTSNDCTGVGTLQGNGTISGQYDWQYGSRDGQQYAVQNNVWGSGAQQTITWTGNTFKVTAFSGSGDTSGSPASYPSSFIGSNNSRNTASSGLPVAISSISSIPTSWTWATNGASGTYNASYDIWFSTSSGGDSGNPSGGYLMVWAYKPGGANPRGSTQGGATIAGLGDVEVWSDKGTTTPYCTSYVLRNTANTVTFDLNALIQHAVTNGWAQSSWYLTNVFAGFEIWNGAATGLETKAFCVKVNKK